jgi:hypothetical protein
MAKWDESKHPRKPAGAPASGGGEFATVGSIATKIGRHVGARLGILSPPRSHKKKFTPPSPFKAPKITGDKKIDKALHFQSLKESHALRRGIKAAAFNIGAGAASQAVGAGVAIGTHAIAHKLGGHGVGSYRTISKRTGKTPNYVAVTDDPSWPLYGTPQKIPNYVTPATERGFKLGLQFSTVKKKRRPTFPTGYNKSYLDD